MRNFISNADEGLKIEAFKDLKWVKMSTPIMENNLYKKLFEFESVLKNIKEHDGYYMSVSDETAILGFESEIGICEHPLITFAYASMWYESNLGGIYLIGIDNVKNEYFAPLK